MSSYYDILQVSPKADPEVIEAAYRKLAFKHHPDRNHGHAAVEMMKALNEARDVLMDPVRRRDYDRSIGLNRDRHATNDKPGKVIVFTCPKCTRSVELELRTDLKLVQCPECQQIVRLRPAGHENRPSRDHDQKLSAVFNEEISKRLQDLYSIGKDPRITYYYVLLPVIAILYGFLMTFAINSKLDGRIGTSLLMIATIGISALALGCAYYSHATGRNRGHDYDESNQPLVLEYHLPGVAKANYSRMIESLFTLRNTECHIVVDGQKGLARGNRVLVSSATPHKVKCNVPVLRMKIDREDLYFFPDCILVFYRGHFSVVPYREIGLNIREQQIYLEDRIVGYRWQHQRVNGGPDMRFKHNPQIALYQSFYERLPCLYFTYGHGSVALLGDSDTVIRRFQHSIVSWIAHVT